MDSGDTHLHSHIQVKVEPGLPPPAPSSSSSASHASVSTPALASASAALPAAAAQSTTHASSGGGRELPNQLSTSFSGDTLACLEQLGVAAVNSADVERDVLESAMGNAQLAASAASTPAAPSSSTPTRPAAVTAAAAARRVIPKKSTQQRKLARMDMDEFIGAPTKRALHASDHIEADPAPPRFGSGGSFRGHAGSAGRKRAANANDRVHLQAHARRMPKVNEAELNRRQRLIAAGEMTPFGTMNSTSPARAASPPASARSGRQEGGSPATDVRVKMEPGTAPASVSPARAAKRVRRAASSSSESQLSDSSLSSDFIPESPSEDDSGDANEQFEEAIDDEVSELSQRGNGNSWRYARRRQHHAIIVDDVSDEVFQERVETWLAHRKHGNNKTVKSAAATLGDSDPADESYDVLFDGGYMVPGHVWQRLFHYQKTCIKWLWELHCQKTGGIIADEMGLGKTCQTIAYLGGLHYTAQRSTDGTVRREFSRLKPTLIIVPATILAQWLREFHEWYPELRVMILHDSIAHSVPKKDIVNKVFQHGHVLITTYQSLRINRELLLHREWGYVFLDEGHKIRNPDAAVTLLCKQLLSIHRIILTGQPIQNSLVELWSLFDFIFPGKLGTLPVFHDEFVDPIVRGGYTSAQPIQVQLAYKCALVLRDLINPYILRRSKADVAQHLPQKTEQVLFCNLTPMQRRLYKTYIDSVDVKELLSGHVSLFQAIHYLRKICNHPHLLQLTGRTGHKRPPAQLEDYGAAQYSGKLQVVQQVLRMWKQQGHRCLLFCQTRQMLDIIETFVQGEGYVYRRLDGNTPIRQRLTLMDEFNTDDRVFIMLLTTRAGGLGTNLTGADRVILYDPDWNPSSDAQSKERAYRIGQLKATTIYRLITRGCIEEKVYHRQIWKQFLADKVLKDPAQKRFFSHGDIKDLLAFDDGTRHDRRSNGATETAGIFQRGEIQQAHVARAAEAEAARKRHAQRRQKDSSSEQEEGEIEDDEQEIQSSPSSRRAAPPAASPKIIKLETAPYHESLSNEAQSSQDNNRILNALFSRQGIQSAMDHDVILNSTTRQDATSLLQIAQEAANRAVAKLKQSREQLQNQPLNAPTWTGRSGFDPRAQHSSAATSSSSSSGAAGSSNRFGRTVVRPNVSTATHAVDTNREAIQQGMLRAPTELSCGVGGKHFDSSVSGFHSSHSQTNSAAASGANALSSTHLIAQIQQRKQLNQASASPSPAAAVAALNYTEPRYQSLLQDILALLRVNRQGTTSELVVKQFDGDDRLVSKADQRSFKTMLKQVANQVRGTKETRWFIKQEFE